MQAGIPGTGIGGMYYILLAFVMPVREAIHLVQGNSSPRRWLNVFLQVLNAIGILGSIWLMGWLLTRLIHFFNTCGIPALKVPQQVTLTVCKTSAVTALITLAVVVLAVNVLPLIIPRKRVALVGDALSDKQ